MNELLSQKSQRELKILELHDGAKGTPVEPVLRELIEIFEKEIYLYTMYGLNEFKTAVEEDNKGKNYLDIIVDENGATVKDLILAKLKND